MERPLCPTCNKNLAKKLVSRHGKTYYTKECSTCRRHRYKRDGGPNTKHPCYSISLLPDGPEKAERLRIKTILTRPDGKWRTNAKYRRFLKQTCERCGFIPEDLCQLQAHHLDHNHHNNTPSNIQTLCANCHMLYHTRHRQAPIKSST